MASAEDLAIADLELAFLQYMVGRVSAADRVVTTAEQQRIDVICPPDALRRAGFVDAAGAPTALAEAARVRALMELPGALSEDRRLALVTPLAGLATVDGVVDLREKSYVSTAGQLLCLSIPAIAAHLASTGVTIAGAPR